MSRNFSIRATGAAYPFGLAVLPAGLAGLALGYASMNHTGALWWAALTLPTAFFWGWLSRRQSVFAFFFGYYVAAGRGLFYGSGIFFSEAEFSYEWGLFCLLAPPLLLSAVWTACWRKQNRTFLLILALILISLPPAGIIGWSSPLLSAGILFPGWGLSGLFLTVLVLLCLAALGERLALSKPLLPAVIPPIFLSVLACLANAFYRPYETPVNEIWTAVQTEWGESPDSFLKIARLRAGLDKQEATVAVWPEASAGYWDVNAAYLERQDQALQKAGRSALLGASRMTASGMKENMITAIGVESGVVWTSRVVVPFSMWRPWADTGEKWTSDWMGSGVRPFRGKRVGALICYEQLLVWPAVMMLAAKPDIVMGVANNWWGKDTSILGIQQIHTASWARLAGARILFSANR